MTNCNRRTFLKAVCGGSAALMTAGNSVRAAAKGRQQRPNIVLIMADDMGYGDVGCYNPESKIPTPNIDRLAEQGVRFTNAHAAGAWCVPSRYGLLTGRYPFRTVLNTQQSIIEEGRMTIGSLLQDNGYYTACIGKWHLGFEGGSKDIDWDKPMRGGPVDRGFDYFFGMHASLDIPPYYYIENDRCVQPPTGHIGASHSSNVTPIQGAFWREGPIAEGFKHAEVLPRFTRKAIDIIDKHGQAQTNEPFFLYLALAAPHTPWLPTGKFQGVSDAGDYGDFVAQVDAAVGQVLDKLDEAGLTGDTLVIYTSDNGPVWFDQDIDKYNHRSVYHLRGMKADSYEGGHRMPFIARWPGKTKPGSMSDETICFTDMLATFAAILGETLPEDAGEDSYNILPALLGESPREPIREATVVHNSIRAGDWKLILGRGQGNLSRRYAGKYEPKGPRTKGELYNLSDDISESNNLYAEHPEIVERLTELMKRYKKQGRSTPWPRSN